MYTTTLLLVGIYLLSTTNALPLSTHDLANSTVGPQPGESSYYSTYGGKQDAFPANVSKDAVMPTAQGAPGPDDLLFQNLLSAEWAIYSFYQQGVEAFNTTTFTEAGFSNTTYDRIIEIRDNEAGHLRIFQDLISPTSVKPGACHYDFGFSNVTEYLALQTYLEISSMAFLTGLILQGKTDLTLSALVAIAETESRHNAWSMIDVWNADPFAGPADTIYPYGNQILTLLNGVTVPGSCPAGNPPYPYPDQNLPPLDYDATLTDAQPGSSIKFTFPGTVQPVFEENKEYYSVAFHGVNNISMPFDTKTNSSVIPSEIEARRGVMIFVIADEVGAPTKESVVAGPLILLETPFVSNQITG